jgi:hypothetical protein
VTASPRYAPAREDGTRPYVVTVSRKWSGDVERLVYACRPADARWLAIRRGRYTAAIADRRATPEDVTNLKEYR